MRDFFEWVGIALLAICGALVGLLGVLMWLFVATAWIWMPVLIIVAAVRYLFF